MRQPLPLWMIISGYYPHFSNQQGRPAAAIRKDNLKLVVHLETDSRELYDLSKDPGEQQNLAATNPEKVRALYKELENQLRESGANRLKPNPSFRKQSSSTTK